jgi:hypothetical protein
VREYLRQKRIKRGLPPDRPPDPRWAAQRAQKAAARAARAQTRASAQKRPRAPVVRSERDCLLAACISSQEYPALPGAVRGEGGKASQAQRGPARSRHRGPV